VRPAAVAVADAEITLTPTLARLMVGCDIDGSFQQLALLWKSAHGMHDCDVQTDPWLVTRETRHMSDKRPNRELAVRTVSFLVSQRVSRILSVVRTRHRSDTSS
jgi:hypothetical protein